MKLYLKNASTGKRYEIVEFDKEAGTVTLRGGTTTFTEEYSKERMKKFGYTLERVEDDDA